MAFIYPLASSSSGNATYVGSTTSGILIDVGINMKTFVTQLDAINVSPTAVRAIFLTHPHQDHIKGLIPITQKYNIPIYSSKCTLQSLIDTQNVCSTSKLKEIDKCVVGLDDMVIRCFDTPHDTEKSLGFTIEIGDKKVAVCTDLGHITPIVKKNLTQCSAVLIESNYDVNMLKNGLYPPYLKKRISSNNGHLSNIQCGEILAELIKSGTTTFILGHLSTQNNLPSLAYENASSILNSISKDYILKIAPKTGDAQIFNV